MDDTRQSDPLPVDVDVLDQPYRRRIRLHKVYWLFWIVGAALILMSWVHVVTPQVGWIGFGIAVTGSVLSRLRFRPFI